MPSNDTQKAGFNEYITYFRSKQRAGVVTLRKMLLYLLPPCEQAFKLHQFAEGQMLGVFTDENASNYKALLPLITYSEPVSQPMTEEKQPPEENKAHEQKQEDEGKEEDADGGDSSTLLVNELSKPS